MYLDIRYDKPDIPWKEFENETADIFESFGYHVLRDVNFKTGRRYQIDVIAFDNIRVFCIDCKYHKYISPSIEEFFTSKQIDRMREYLKLDKRDFLGKRIFFFLVTRYANDFASRQTVNKILSVGIHQLNYLLNNIEVYEDRLLSLKFD
ncbi:MAG: NERD domain-containing protein [Candidatus Parvarchaeota archaeon]|nr:NERD domain-containing protein [Candidatus Parvarchaeota archaeon]MCW1301998.1 NERD domain-containing protein [Candidatus Parvarchaeota archaeon]